MICSRCGTEYFNEDKICPRCGLGRPKVHKKLPAWLKWSFLGVIAAGIIGLSIWLYTIVSFDSDWINGAWEGGNLALNFNSDEDTFLLINGDTVLEGTYAVGQNTITLVTINEQTYVYRYNKISDSKMKLSFNQDDTVRHVTVTKDEASVQEEESVDRSEELGNNQSGFVTE